MSHAHEQRLIDDLRIPAICLITAWSTACFRPEPFDLGSGDEASSTGAMAESTGTAGDDADESSGGAVGGMQEEPAHCGDGNVDAGEECDDGRNDGAYGGCNRDCTLAARCGDGLLDERLEVCDDGNQDSADSCLGNCTVPMSCADIKSFDPSAPDGRYRLGTEGHEAYCDMATVVMRWSQPRLAPGSHGVETAGGGIAVGEIGGGAAPDMVVFHIEDPYEENQGVYRVAWDLDDGGEPTGGWSKPQPIPGGWGHSTQGGDVALADLDGNGSPELLVAHIDMPAGDNQAFYRIGWNLDDEGQATGGWTDPPIAVAGWFSPQTAGAGIDAADLDGNGIPEVVVFHLRNLPGDNEGFFEIGWNLNADGYPEHWGPMTHVPGWFGDVSRGAGLALVETEVGSPPSIVVFHLDDPAGEDRGYYRVADLDEHGNVVGGWSDLIGIPEWWGEGNRAGGVGAWDLGEDGSVDLVFFQVEHRDGDNPGYYRWGFTSVE